MVLRTSQPRKTPTNQNMTLYLSTNHNAIIFHPRGDGHELSWKAGLDCLLCGQGERGSKASQKLHQVAGECKKKKARDRLDRSSKWHAIVWTARRNGTRSFGPRVQIASPFVWSLGNYYTTCKLLKMIAGTDMCQRGDPLAKRQTELVLI